MLNLLTGKQRAGKTFYCVTLIIEYLRTSKRHIYCNLPLNPDAVADYACGGKIRHPAKYRSYLKRIHLFKSFRAYSELICFCRLNKDFALLVKLYRDEHLILPQGNISDFWNHIAPNSIVFLDELYQYFSSADHRDSALSERRKQLLTYTRQHGHFKDDMYLISHSASDVDVHIRKGCQYQYVVRNSKYTNMIPHRLFRGLKWPVQFFIVQGYEYGEKNPSDVWHVLPDKKIFKCYDSFSSAETLNKKLADPDAESSDTGLNFKRNFNNFLKQFVPIFSILVVGVACCYGYYDSFQSSFLSSAKTSVKKLPEKQQSSKPKVEQFIKVSFVSPLCIVFSDGFELKIGDDYHGFKCEKIYKDFGVFTRSGKRYNLRLSTLRTGNGEGGQKGKKFSKKVRR